MQQYFEEFSAWASKLQDPQTGNTFAEILDGQIGEHRYVLVPSSCLRLCSNAEPDREALSSDCPSGCISLKSVGCVWYMPCMDVAGVCAPNDRHRVEALRSFLQDDQPAEMRGSGGSSTGYDPMRSSELDHPSDSSALASEEQHAAGAVSQQRSLGPESAEVEDDAPVDDRQTRQDAHQAQEAVDNEGDEAEETEQAQRADDNQPQHGAVFVSPGTAGASSRSPQDAVLVCRSCLFEGRHQDCHGAR